MRLRQYALPLVAVLFTASACKKNEPVVTAAPVPPPAPAASRPGPAPPAPPAVDPNVAIERARAEMINTLAQEIFFDFDQFDIRSQDMAVLDAKAALMSRNNQVRIRIAGHADERGSDEYNLVLGNRRALAAKAYLERKGVDGSRIDVISYGEERPADPSATEAAWARNRRGAFEVTAGRDQLGTIR